MSVSHAGEREAHPKQGLKSLVQTSLQLNMDMSVLCLLVSAAGPLNPSLHLCFTNYICHCESWWFTLACFEPWMSAQMHVHICICMWSSNCVCVNVCVCVISYLLSWCCCRCWTVALWAVQAVCWLPSPSAAPALYQDGWLVCSPSVCPVQCHCELYLRDSLDTGNKVNEDFSLTNLFIFSWPWNS